MLSYQSIQHTTKIKHSSPPLIEPPFCQIILSLFERCPLVEGTITCIHGPCYKEFMSFAEGDFSLVAFKRRSTVYM